MQKFVKMDCEKSNDESCIVTVLADKWIQRWRFSNSGPNDQLLFEDAEILRKIRSEFCQKFCANRSNSCFFVVLNSLKLFVLVFL